MKLNHLFLILLYLNQNADLLGPGDTNFMYNCPIFWFYPYSEPINRGCTVANPPVFFSHSPKSTKMAGALKKVNKFFKVKSFALGLTVDLLQIYNIYIV